MPPARKRSRDLNQQCRFAYSGIAAEQKDGAPHETPSGDPVELGKTRGEPWRVVRRSGKCLKRKEATLARLAAGGVRARAGRAFFRDGIPFAAGIAFALPAAVDGATALANEGCVTTAHSG